MSTQSDAQGQCDRDWRAVRGAGLVTIIYGAAIIVLGCYTGWATLHYGEKEPHGVIDLLLPIVAGLALAHIGIGILLRNEMCLFLSSIVTASVGVWQFILMWTFGVRTATIGIIGIPLITLVVLWLALMPLRRLRACERIEEIEKVVRRTRE
jgi:hypothetical protein